MICKLNISADAKLLAVYYNKQFCKMFKYQNSVFKCLVIHSTCAFMYTKTVTLCTSANIPRLVLCQDIGSGQPATASKLWWFCSQDCLLK